MREQAILDRDSAYERLRMERAIPGVISRDEIGYFHRPAFPVQNGFQNRGIADIELLRGFETVEFDCEGAVAGVSARSSEKLVKNGIAIELGRQHQTIFARLSTRALIPQLPIRPRSRLPMCTVSLQSLARGLQPVKKLTNG